MNKSIKVQNPYHHFEQLLQVNLEVDMSLRLIKIFASPHITPSHSYYSYHMNHNSLLIQVNFRLLFFMEVVMKILFSIE